MSDETTANPGPAPMQIDPDAPGGRTQASPSNDDSLASQIESHMQESPYAQIDPQSNPFAAGFHAAMAHLRDFLKRL